MISRRGVHELQGQHRGERLFIAGSGPSLEAFPLGELAGRPSVALNRAVQAFRPTYWLFGCPKFSRWGATKLTVEAKGLRVVANERHVQWIERRATDLDLYTFTNNASQNSQEWPSLPLGWASDYLPGRWTIATVALSLAVLLGASSVVLIGVDMGKVDGAYYANSAQGKVPGRQDSLVGQWRKWLQYGFRSGLWPIAEVLTVSPHFQANCPGTPVKTVSLEEALA